MRQKKRHSHKRNRKTFFPLAHLFTSLLTFDIHMNHLTDYWKSYDIYYTTGVISNEGHNFWRKRRMKNKNKRLFESNSKFLS